MDDADDVMSSRVVLKGKEVESEDLEKEKWKKQMNDHKTLVFFLLHLVFLFEMDIITSLAENIHNLLEISLSPSIPFLHLCELSLLSITLSFAYEPTLFTSYLNLSVAPLLLPHWL